MLLKSDIWFSQSYVIQKGGKRAIPGTEKNKKKGLGAEYILWLENSEYPKRKSELELLDKEELFKSL